MVIPVGRSLVFELQLSQTLRIVDRTSGDGRQGLLGLGGGNDQEGACLSQAPRTESGRGLVQGVEEVWLQVLIGLADR